MKRWFDSKQVHAAFEVSLALKGANAVVEVIAGLLAYAVSERSILKVVQAVTRAELAEDPLDFVANHLLQAAQALSVSSRHFAAFYLLSHGIIKLWLITGLWRGKRAYYPAAMVVFGLFILYQIYRFSFTKSLLLLAITVLDVAIIWLTWVEYRNLPRDPVRR